MILTSQLNRDPFIFVVSSSKKHEIELRDVLKALEMGHLSVTHCAIDTPEDAILVVREELSKFRRVKAVVWMGDTGRWLNLSGPKEVGPYLFVSVPDISEIKEPSFQEAFILGFLSAKERVDKHLTENRRYIHLQTEDEIVGFLEKAPEMSLQWAYDIESAKLAPYHRDFFLISIAFCSSPGEAYGFGLCHPQSRLRFWRRNYHIWEKFRDFMCDRRIHWVGHNILKFDKPGIELGLKCRMVDSYQDFWNRFDDTMIMKYTLIESAKGRYNLATCAKEELEWSDWKIDTDNLQEIPLDTVIRYNCQDSDATWQIYQSYQRKLRDFSPAYSVDLISLYRNIHLPNAINAALMDGNGIRCNEEYARHLKLRYETIIEQLTIWLRDQEPVRQLEKMKGDAYIAGRKKIPDPGSGEKWKIFQDRVAAVSRFSPTGTSDCMRLLWEIMAIPYPEQFGRTAKKQEERITLEILEFLSKQGYDLCKALEKIHKLSDSLSSYVYPILANTQRTYDGLSHPSFYPPGTETGRYSCKNADENAGVGGVGENIQKISRDKEIKDLYCSRFE